MTMVFPDRLLQPVVYKGYGFSVSGPENNTMIRGILDGEADISLPIMTQDSIVEKYVQFIQPAFTGTQIGFLVNPHESISYLPVFQPFSTSVWFIGILSYFLIVGYIALIRYDKIHLKGFSLISYQLLFGQRNETLWPTVTDKVIITLWSQLARLMTIVYKLFLLKAFIPTSVIQLASNFNTLDKVVQRATKDGYKLVAMTDNGSAQWITEKRSLLSQIDTNLDNTPYTTEKVPSVRKLANYTINHPHTIMIEHVEVLLTLKNFVLNVTNNQIFVVNDHTSTDLRYEFMVARKNLFNKSTLISVGKSIIDIRQFGLVEKLARQYRIDHRMVSRHLTPLSNSDWHPLTFDFVTRAVIVPAVLYGFACIILFFEFIYRCNGASVGVYQLT